MDFELQLEKFYTKYLNKGGSAIDIGAHLGRHTIPIAKCVDRKGSVIAFEPIPSINKILKKKIDNEGLSNVVSIYNNACSNFDGSSSFCIATDLLDQSGLKKRHIYTGPTKTKSIDVKVKELDSILNEHNKPINFIKIDVEGAEYGVIEGAKKTIKMHKPVIGFECGAAGYLSYIKNSECIYDLLTSFGYVIFNIYGNTFSRKAFEEATTIQRYWDYIACHEKDEKLVSAILDCINMEYQLENTNKLNSSMIFESNKDLYGVISDLEVKIEKILNSNSWRVTKPLRYLKQTFKNKGLQL